jgi:hypothetical protein
MSEEDRAKAMANDRADTYAEGLRTVRDSALDAAIEVCEVFAKEGGSASQCVAALRDLKNSMPLARASRQN